VGEEEGEEGGFSPSPLRPHKKGGGRGKGPACSDDVRQRQQRKRAVTRAVGGIARASTLCKHIVFPSFSKEKKKGMPSRAAAQLSRGRTVLKRGHSRIGTVVHEAGEWEEYVHLTVSLCTDLDSGEDLAPLPPAQQQQQQSPVLLRVAVGESAHPLVFQVEGKDLALGHRLVDNLCLSPWESVTVSYSADMQLGPLLPLIRGFTTYSPISV